MNVFRKQFVEGRDSWNDLAEKAVGGRCPSCRRKSLELQSSSVHHDVRCGNCDLLLTYEMFINNMVGEVISDHTRRLAKK